MPPRPKTSIFGKKLPPRVSRPPEESVWKGPAVDGVTQSLISSWLCCRERFRVRSILGLAEQEKFEIRMEYGNLWHACEEEHAANPYGEMTYHLMEKVAVELGQKYRRQQAEILKWARICALQFPIYLDYWKDHNLSDNVTPIYQEESFKIPYQLPSGRTVFLRGKFDRVDDVPGVGIRLGEHKTKSNPDKIKITRQLTNDLQCMTYLSALGEIGLECNSVLYNVIRRPLSGGKGTIRQRKKSKNTPAETLQEYYDRLRCILNTCQDEYFMRWEVPVPSSSIAKFRRTTLEPILENMLDDFEWWDWCLENKLDPYHSEVRADYFPEHRSRHYRLPYGIYNVILEGGTGDIDEYLTTGSTIGLRRITTLFPELDDAKN